VNALEVGLPLALLGGYPARDARIERHCHVLANVLFLCMTADVLWSVSSDNRDVLAFCSC
jgi:hypothetical protein